MRIAICDDDAGIVAAVRTFLETTYRQLGWVIDSYHAGEALLKAISGSGRNYDLILLDIEMKGINGIETAKSVRALSPESCVVFITSHEEFALTGYEVSAFRFLTKPIRQDKLMEAVEAVKEARFARRELLIPWEGETTRVAVPDILYVEAQNQTVRLVLKQRTLWHRATIDSYARQLSGDDFYRVHRSYLVNLNAVAFMGKQELRMANGDLVPMSRLRSKEFAEAFRAYIKRTAR